MVRYRYSMGLFKQEKLAEPHVMSGENEEEKE
jgi:hypothetical protein